MSAAVNVVVPLIVSTSVAFSCVIAPAALSTKSPPVVSVPKVSTSPVVTFRSPVLAPLSVRSEASLSVTSSPLTRVTNAPNSLPLCASVMSPVVPAARVVTPDTVSVPVCEILPVVSTQRSAPVLKVPKLIAPSPVTRNPSLPNVPAMLKAPVVTMSLLLASSVKAPPKTLLDCVKVIASSVPTAIEDVPPRFSMLVVVCVIAPAAVKSAMSVVVISPSINTPVARTDRFSALVTLNTLANVVPLSSVISPPTVVSVLAPAIVTAALSARLAAVRSSVPPIFSAPRSTAPPASILRSCATSPCKAMPLAAAKVTSFSPATVTSPANVLATLPRVMISSVPAVKDIGPVTAIAPVWLIVPSTSTFSVPPSVEAAKEIFPSARRSVSPVTLSSVSPPSWLSSCVKVRLAASIVLPDVTFNALPAVCVTAPVALISSADPTVTSDKRMSPPPSIISPVEETVPIRVSASVACKESAAFDPSAEPVNLRSFASLSVMDPARTTLTRPPKSLAPLLKARAAPLLLKVVAPPTVIKARPLSAPPVMTLRLPVAEI